MALDPRYISTQVIQEIFVDQVTGIPLAGGKVKFTVDTSRNTLKPVYMLTGSPPNYTYTVYPVDADGFVTLNESGTLDPALYFYPFNDVTNQIELYYVQVFSADGVTPQTQRQGMPNFTDELISDTREVNYIPNGQFYFQVPLPIVDEEEGKITATETAIAYGGGTLFSDNAGSTDFVTFVRTTDYIVEPTNQPRYNLRLQTTVANPGDVTKDIVWKFQNVNRFASNTDKYTFIFYAKSNSGSLTGNVVLYKNFGTDGDATEITEVVGTSFTLGASMTKYAFAITFGTNEGKNIGALNDDYVAIGFRTDPGVTRDLETTDNCLIIGDKVDEDFPVETTREQQAQSLWNDLKYITPDGMYLNLPMILTKNGIDFDDSSVGSILISVCDVSHKPTGYLLADGSTLLTSDYQPDGVPNLRLFNKIYNSDFAGPGYGTGDDFFVCIEEGSSSEIIFIMNTSPGAATAADAATSGFTVIDVTDGTGGNGLDCFTVVFGNSMYGISQVVGVPSSASPWTESGASFVADSLIPIRPGTPLTKEVHRLIFDSNFVASEVLNFTIPGNSNHVYFQVDGVGTDPGGYGAGYRCNVGSTDAAQVQMAKLTAAITSRKSSSIVFTAASLVTPGSYYILYAKIAGGGEQKYVVWSTVDGVGAEPVVASAIYIKVDLLASDTARQVAVKHAQVIISYSFKLPDPRGEIIRFNDFGALNDPDAALRYSRGLIIASAGDSGTNQIYSVQQHTHSIIETDSDANTVVHGFIAGTIIHSLTPPVDVPYGIEYYGGRETVPDNISFNAYIKY